MRAAVLALCAAGALAGWLHGVPVVHSPPKGTPSRENFPWSAELSAMSCTECTTIVGTLQAIATNATALAQFVALMDDGCKLLFPTDNATLALCEALASGAGSLLPWLDKQMETLAWDIPQTFCSVFVPVCQNPCCAAPTTPEQVHLSLTGDYSEMRVVWVTLNDSRTSTVAWGPASAAPTLPYSALGTTRTYTFGGWVGVIHVATMTGLARGQAYSYRVGDATDGWSQTFNFTVLPANIGTDARPLVLLQVGDMAYDNQSDVTVATMSELVAAGQVDVMLHVGDISYADGEQPHWDMFWRKVEPIAARIPYLVVDGNHERVWSNATALYTRVSMPMENITDNLYYSLDIGSAHVFMGDTETVIDTASIDAAEVSFMANDFAKVNRTATPWLIVTGHRPLYCSNGDKTQCEVFTAVLRFQAEALFHSSHVDLVINAHEHGWERSYPVYDNAVVSTSYDSPTAPVYVVNGAGGNREGNELPNGAAWTAGRSREIGYATYVVTPHALAATFFAANGTAVDAFTITK